MRHLIEALPTANLIEALPTATKFIIEMTCEVLLQSCDALLQSCDALFYGDKTGFLAKSTSQPPVLKQKSTSQVAVIKSQPKISTARVSQDAQRYPSPMALPR